MNVLIVKFDKVQREYPREDQNINKYKDNLPMASSFVNTSDL